MSNAERLVCSVAPVEAILRLAERYPVFPCRRGAEEVVINGEARVLKAKSPLVARGLYRATQDPAQIRAWWSRWPDALVGVPTGSKTGLIVVDSDTDKHDAAANDWIQEHVLELMGTRYHTTLSGGRHYLYRAPAGTEYRNGVCLRLAGVQRQGIDLRAEGGYIIWWPLHGGSAAGEVTPLPAAFVDEQRIETKDLPPLPEKTPESWARERKLVADALAYLDPSDYAVWMRCGLAIHLAGAGCDDAFNLWHAWSSGDITGDCPANYSGINDCRYHWASYRHDKARGGMVTLGTVFELAKAHGYRTARESEPPPPPLEAYANEVAPAPALPLREMPKPDLSSATIEEVRFVVHPLLPRKFVTLLAGHGDAGKTLLALTVAAHVACGRPFADLPTAAGRVLFVSLEDSAELIWLRLQRIAAAYELDPEVVRENMTVLDLPDNEDADGALAFEENDLGIRRLKFTAAYEQIRARAEGQALVVVDNSSDAYDANENERRLVRRFLRKLQAVGRLRDAAVWLLAHIDKAGARNGTAGETYSGSTAWHNSVRSRIALLQSESGLELVHEKCNLAKKLEHPIPLSRGEHGVPEPLSRAERAQGAEDDCRAVLAAIRGARLAGLSVPVAFSGPRTTVAAIVNRPEIPEGLAQSHKRIRAAIASLERDGRVWREIYRNSDRKEKERYVCASS